MFILGRPCDEDGDLLDPVSPPIIETQDLTNWTPFRNCAEFKTAKFLYKCCQMLASNIDSLTTRTSMVQSMPYQLVVCHGKASLSHMTVPSPRIPPHG